MSKWFREKIQKEGGYLIGSVRLPGQFSLVSKASNGGTPTDLTLTWPSQLVSLGLEHSKAALEQLGAV